MRDVQDWQQSNSGFDLLSIFLCSLIQTLTPPPNNALLTILDMYRREERNHTLLCTSENGVREDIRPAGTCDISNVSLSLRN